MSGQRSGGERWGAGYFPNVPLTTHEGKSVRFFDDIIEVRKKLGLFIAEIQDGSNDRNLSLVIGNQATGRWMKRSPFENPHVLADQVGSWLHNWKSAPEGSGDYANAPKLRVVSKGEDLFRTRCTSCHMIGSESSFGSSVGPNLLGVTDRRQRDWLFRWISAPDRMLASGDPIATELFERHNRVPMPNMRLTGVEMGALLKYIEGETDRIIALAPESSADSDSTPESCCLKDDQVVLATVDSEPFPEQKSEVARLGMRNGFSGMAMLFFGGLCWILGWRTSSRGSLTGEEYTDAKAGVS